jgi:murein DD-endopeptidase MepM/ murein hydrolase activator NlpD
MKWFNDFKAYLAQKIKYTASDPDNFEVKWTFRATRVQLYSLLVIIVLIVAVLSGLFVVNGPLASYFSKNDVSIERKKLEEQHLKIRELNQKINSQEKYLETIRRVISGEIIEDTTVSALPDVANVSPGDINSEPTENEKELAEKVKDDLRSGTYKKAEKSVPYFSVPVKGVVSQKFDLVNHPAIDVVTQKNQTVLACLSGTVIYSGYTQKDGFMMIIDHANGYVSVYKHNKAVLKKSGSKVQMNDAIAIVGNTGENSSGPHLHFELWYNQSAIDPQIYMNFNR